MGADWTCVIPGVPIGKGRPRASARHGRVFMRTPEKTAKWEAFAAETMRMRWMCPMLESPVSVAIVAVFPRPQRLVCKHKRACGCTGERVPHVARPDADNVAKAVCDALEKAGVLKNDSQVWSVTAVKMIAGAKEQPHVQVTVRES
jgi:Holliday junction resolvase RusA-like endonuclease